LSDHPDHSGLVDPKTMQGDVAEYFGWRPEVLGQDVRRRMGEPVSHEQGVEL
jgi:hypothetical protein